MQNLTDYLDQLEDLPLASSLRALREAQDALCQLDQPEKVSTEEVEKRITGLSPELYAFLFRHAGIKAKANLSDALSRAIAKLGFDRVKKLIFLHIAFSRDLAAGKNLLDKEFSSQLWSLNFRTANIAVHWAERLMPQWSEEIFYLAMLQNIGITAFAQLDSSHHRGLRDSSREIPLADKERDHYGFDHYDLAKGIIKRWEMPEIHIGAQIYESSHGQSCGQSVGEEHEDLFMILYLSKFRAAARENASGLIEDKQSIDPYFAFSQAVLQIARDRAREAA